MNANKHGGFQKGHIGYNKGVTLVRAGEYLPCLSCKKVVYKEPWFIKTGRNAFCSRICSSSFHKRERHPLWKRGKTISNKYERFTTGTQAGRYCHRSVMELSLGRSLSNKEVVHHINGNKLDNRLENLMVVSRKEHNKIHHPRQYCKNHQERRAHSRGRCMMCYLREIRNYNPAGFRGH